MKNKKIFLWAFLFILLAQIGLGVSQVCKYLDILQNGKIVKVSYVSIGNIDNYEYKHNQISLYSATFLFPFKNDIKLVYAVRFCAFCTHCVQIIQKHNRIFGYSAN